MTYEVDSGKWGALFDANIPMHVWTIAGVGSMHESAGEQGDSLTDHWWKAENFSANDPGEYYYLENPKTAFPRQYNGVATSGESLAELWALGPRGRAPETAKGLMAQSQEASAGLMKRFAEFVDPLPPEIKIQDGLLNVIAANNSTNEPRPYITLTDPVSVAQPMPSGIYKAVITQVGGHYSSTQTFGGAPDGVLGPDIHTVTPHTFDHGTYIVTALDGLGNQTSQKFTISPFPPVGDLNVKNASTVIDPIAQTFTASLLVDLFDPAGIATATLTQTASPADIVTNLPVDSNVQGATARVNPVITVPETYTLSATDPAGNTPVNVEFDVSGRNYVSLFSFNSEGPATSAMTGLQSVPVPDQPSLLELQSGSAQGTYLSEVIPTYRPKYVFSGIEELLLGAVMTGASSGGGGSLTFPGQITTVSMGPRSSTAIAAQSRVEIRTADAAADLETGAFQTIALTAWQAVDNDCIWTFGSPCYQTIDQTPAAAFPLTLKKYHQVRVTMQNFGVPLCLDTNCSSACPPENTQCHSYANPTYTPKLDRVEAAGYSVALQKASRLTPGTNVTLTAPGASNVTLTIPTINRLGGLVAGHYIVPGPSDKSTLPLDQSVSIRNEADVTGPVKIKIDYGESVALTIEEAAGLTIIRTDPVTGLSAAIDAVVVSTPDHTVSGTFVFNGPGDFGAFQVQYPKIAPPALVASLNWVGDGPEFQILASPGDLAVASVPQSDPRVSAAIPAAATAGRSLISNVYQTQTSAAAFQPAGAVVFRYNSASPAMQSVIPASLKVYQLDATLGAFVLLSPQVLDQTAQSITVNVSTPGIYAIFGSPQSTLTPTSGVAGAPFTINGSGFGPFAGSSTRVRFGVAGSTAAVSLWSNTRIEASVPDISTGAYAVFVERQSSTTLTTLSAGTFTVIVPAVSSGPVLALAPRDGGTVNASTPTIVAAYASAVGVDTATVRLALDGVDVTSLAVVTSLSATFVPTEALAEGTHTVTAGVLDSEANAAASTATFLVDTIPPATTLSIGGQPAAAISTSVFTTAVFSLSAADAGSGVAETELFLDVDAASCDLSSYDPDAAPGSCANPFYDGPFTLAPGTHTVSFFSYDAADNDESLNALAVTAVAPAPPTLTLTPVDGSTVSTTMPMLAASYAAGDYALSTASVRLALDGVDVTTQAIITLSSATHVPQAALAQGTHTLTSSVSDVLGVTVNAASRFLIDTIAPATALQVNGLAASATSLTVISTDTIGFAAADAGSGVFETLYALDGASPAVFTSTFSLSAGTHTLAYHSADKAGNLESSADAFLTVLEIDTTPPSLALSPIDGSTINTPTPLLLALYADSGRGLNTASFQLSIDGIDVTTQSLVSLTSATFVPSAALAQGAHTVAASVADFAGNLSSATATFNIDSVPPLTSLVIGAPQFSSNTVFIAAVTPIGFTVSDEAQTSYAVDSGSFTVFSGTFTLSAEGEHLVQYFSTDFFGNVEAVQPSTMTVDATAPVSAFEVIGSSLEDSGRVVLSTDSVLSLSAADPVSGGVASGVGDILYSLDGGDPLSYAAPFSLSVGTHVVRFHAVDRVANAETVRTATVAVQERPFDVRPPRTTLAAGFPSYSSTTLYGANGTPFSLATADDALTVGDGTGKGAARSFLSIDAEAFALYAGTFPVVGEGSHSISFYSEDADGNSETAQSAAVGIDLTAPVTRVEVIGSSVTDAQGRVIVSTDTLLALIASDPVSAGIASGSGTIFYAVDAGTEAAYGAPFMLSAGTHTLYYRAQDRVANFEGLRSASFMAVAQDTTTAPSRVLNLAAFSTGYYSMRVLWTAPGDIGEFGQALAYDLRVATFPINDLNFVSATPVTAAPPQSFGFSEAAAFNAAEPGRFYYFALKTINHSGQVSPLSNVAQSYSGDFFAALDPDGRLWQLDANQNSLNLTRYLGTNDQSSSINDFLPWGSTSRALGFDADGGAYVFLTIGGAQQQDKPRAVLYTADSDGVFLSSRPFFAIGGQQSALNQAPGVNLAASVDVDGIVWVAGDAGGSGQNVGLWKVDASGLNLAGLSSGATAHAVLALGGGPVWMTGTDGELVFWRHDPASGDMTRYHWTNTLGAAGSGGRALVETVSGSVWIGGWANTAAGRKAALWRWENGVIELVATSTGVYSDEALGLDLDASGRFWLSGRAQVDGAGAISHAFWTYASGGGGSELALAGLDASVPTRLDFGVGNALSLARGQAWGIAGPSPFGTRSRTLGFGQLTGSVTYAPGFTGGKVAFFTSPTANFDSEVSLFTLLDAPAAGTSFDYTLEGLPAPATYYLAAVYDLSGTVTAGGENPAPGDPLGAALTPAFLPFGGAASVASIAMTPDTTDPTLALLSPVSGSTMTASLFTISGTAADEHLVGELKVALENLADGSWWNPQMSTFTAGGEPLYGIQVVRYGRADAFAWSVDMLTLRQAVVPGKSYRVHAQVSDVSGHSVSASASLVVISTEIPSISTRAASLAMSRDAAGNFWVVTQDFLEERPVEFTLRKYDATGFAVSSTTLPGATAEGSFGVAFDSAGNAWVGGSASGPNGAALALWKVDATGNVLLASTSILNPNGPLFNGGIAVDASGNAWVSGAEATGPNLTFRHGLWKFDANAALVAGYPAYFQRTEGALNGVLDGGLATAIDPAGDIWSAGVSSNPVTGRLDLALWKHDPSGAILSGFPVYRPAAFLDIQGEGGAELGMTISPAGTVWVAASQAYPPFQAADMALLRYDLSGVLVSSSLWHSADQSVVQGRGVALDPAGNPFVIGSLRPGSNNSLNALWKYSASGTLAAGYPKAIANGDDRSLAVDGAATPWIVNQARPQVFGSTSTIAGASGPGYFATAGFSNLSGTLSYPAGFAAGSTVSLVVSRDGFDSDPAFFPLVAPGGPSLPYSVSLLAPATYQILAFVGVDPENLAPGTPVGVYAHYAEVALTTAAPTTGVDFAFYIDTTPPVSAFSFVAGSTLTALATIQGTAADDTALIGPMRLAAQDLDNGLWWDASKQDWVVSTGPIYKLIGAGSLPGPLDYRRWTVDARAGSPLSADYGFGGFSDFLPYGHSFALHEKQIDIAGNEQFIPAVSSFVWRGANGAFGPPDAVGDLSVFNVSFTSASLSWTAPGEHQNIGQALAYDLRYTTAANYNFSTEFSSYTAAVGLPEPPPAYQNSSFTLTGLLPGKRYFLALKTFNHEGGLSGLSNVRQFETIPSQLTSIAVTPSSASVLTGTTEQFAAIGSFTDGSTQAVIAVWSSDAPTVATVTASGLVTALATGTAQITASSGSINGQAAFTVTAPTEPADSIAPVVSLAFSTPSFTASGGLVTIGTQALVSLYAVDPSSDTPVSGVAQILYAVDSTTPSLVYAAPFTLAAGSHTVYFSATDVAGNASAVSSTALTASESPFVGAFSPSSGPIGIGYSLGGFGFGTYGGTATRVKFGVSTTPVSVWNDASIIGTVPGLSTGTYAVTVERLSGSTLTISSAGTYTVTPVIPSLSITSGPIGLPFTLTGTGFGTYSGANSRVLFAGATAPISVWNDSTIQGTIPGVAAGTTTVVVERQTTDGFVSASEPLPFTVTVPSITALSPSSAPIGAAFTLTGFSFGNYAGTNTNVLFDGATSPIAVWNDNTITGTVPGGLAPGAHELIVERRTSDGGVSRSGGDVFIVQGLALATIAPSIGAIGIPFTLTGTGFGAYLGANSRVKFGVSTAAVSVWNDTTISGTVPTLATGAYTVTVERQQGADVSVSNASTFTVIELSIASVAPSSGPIGTVFTLSGAGFGPYAGVNTFLLLGGATTPITVWNDTTITATVPGLLTQGVKELVAVRRNTDGGLSASNTAYFEVTGLSIAAISPSTGAIGIPFTITGSEFGTYLGANSRVRFGVSTAAISVWNNTTITGTVPTLATGAYAVTVERQQGADVSVSNASTFTVIELSIASVAPSSGPIGTVFTLSGEGFGPYAGVNTFLLLGGATTPISVWNDTTITATIPGGLTPGVKELVAARRNTDGGLSISNTAYLEVTGMSIASVSPSTGPIGVPFTIKGSQFGVYLGANSRVRFGVSTAAVSVWNDTTISGTLPALATGTHAVVVERQQGTDVTLSDYSSFTVTELAVGTLTPSSGPIGVAFTITGEHFGPYAGTNTRLLLGGTTVAVAVWNDTTITGSVPNLEAGSQPLWLERKSGTGVQSSATAYFLVTTPEVATLVPSSAPIGAPFSITGNNFGPYAGTNTRVTFNGVSAPISVWNDHAISGTVPGAVSTGPAVLVVERAAGAGVSQSATQAFEVLLPVISTVTPGFGPAGTVVTLTGHGFGPYAGTATKLLVGGSTVAVSVWNDTTIRWTVTAAYPDGDYALVVRRTPVGGTVDSDSATFTVGTGYSGASFGFASTLSLAAQPDVNFEGGLNLPVDEGGRVETASKAAVDVPPNALEEDTEITLKRLPKDGLRSASAEDGKKSAAGEAIEFGPEGTQFNTPVTIELPYDPALVADERALAVHYFNPLRRAWEALPSVVDRARRVVKAQTTHFSIYQPMDLAPTVASQDEFALRDFYAFPNPSRDGSAVTFRIQTGLADTVELRVYDLSGRKIHASSDFTYRGAIDDGNGKGAQNTYDHVWGVGGVGSGVYTYVIKASRAGHSPIIKSGKVGVIK
ncbi:MAG: IPT/TIG domain-containing protein [Elusimicrobia bacterium]|nr:IPT/TIG domain-containing protein [Elusimicrobiota bacterium]